MKYENKFREVLNRPLPSKIHETPIFEIEVELDEPAFESGTVVDSTRISQRVKHAKISVYGGEREIPHFHIKDPEGASDKWRKKTGKKKGYECCVCIEQANYVIHAGKTDTVGESEIRKLIKVLKSPDTSGEYGNISIYERICIEWNGDKDNIIHVDENGDMPDYSNLNSNKKVYEQKK